MATSVDDPMWLLFYFKVWFVKSFGWIGKKAAGKRPPLDVTVITEIRYVN